MRWQLWYLAFASNPRERAIENPRRSSDHAETSLSARPARERARAHVSVAVQKSASLLPRIRHADF